MAGVDEEERRPIHQTEEDFKKDEGKRKWRKIIAGIVGVVLVAVVIILIVVLTSKSDSSPASNVQCPVYKQTGHELTPDQCTNGSQWKTQDCSITQAQCPTGFSSPPTLLISFDGFRAEYFTRNHTPNLQKFRDCGTTSDYTRPSFPSKTFPNHYAIVTGLYPDVHGIVNNFMYDPTNKELFKLRGSGPSTGKWWNGEPIWNTALKAGKVVGTFFWPGSEADIQGMRPTYCYVYNKSLPFEWRISGVLDWLKLPSNERPELMTLYISQPDSTGHEYGPISDEVKDSLIYVDNLFGTLMDNLIDLGLDKCINIVIVSDHGMANVDCGHQEDLSDLIDLDTTFVYTGPVGRINGKYRVDPDGTVHDQPDGESGVSLLSKLECKTYNDTWQRYTRSYLKHELPRRLHYGSNARIDDVIVLTKGYRVITKKGNTYCNDGDHGFDNSLQDMRAMFAAYGPAFRSNTIIQHFENIEIYNMLVELLAINGAPNNGTQGSLSEVFRNPQQYTASTIKSSYTSCPFPDSEQERQSRRDANDCTCAPWDVGIGGLAKFGYRAMLQSLTTKTRDEADMQLDLSAAEIEASVNKNAHSGLPSLEYDDTMACRLAQTDYITGFAADYRMPLWSAFTLIRQGDGSVQGPIRSTKAELETVDCVRADVRLDPSQVTTDCSDYVDTDKNITWAFLYHPGFATSNDSRLDAYIASNIVPMYSTFRSGVWQLTLETVEEYAEKYSNVDVVMGPVFDYDADGRMDKGAIITGYTSGGVPIPSHYFVSLTRCMDGQPISSCNEQDLTAMSIVLPHKPHMDNCWDKEEIGPFQFLQFNVARPRDVELLAGLQFYDNIPLERRARLVTNLEIGLWDRITWMDNTECPDVTSPICPADYTQPPVLLISLDGFRSDYLERSKTPVLQRLSECGTSAEYMRSVYPTLTFPNHYSLATGLYPESHGIVDNTMFDRTLNESFYLGSSTSYNPDWWAGEPLWNTVEKENKTAMTFFWPGSDVAIQGLRPTRYYDYDGEIPYSFRVDQILKWLQGSEGVRPDLAVLYIEKVDKAGHEGGPVSLWVDEALPVVDAYIADLMNGLQRAGLDQCVNVVITADHGMSDISCDRSVLLRDYLDSLYGLYVFPGASGRVGNTYYRSGGKYYNIPEDERVPIDDVVKELSCADPNMRIFPNPEMPTHFHYASHSRVEQLQLVIQDTYLVDRYSPWCPILGQHGWDPSYDTMKALFMAHGPAFQTKMKVEPFENIELYNLLTDILGVSPAENNGTDGSLYHMLRDAPSLPESQASLDYLEAVYPDNDDIYEERAGQNTCRCGLTVEETKTADERLRLTSEDKTALQTQHVPQGLPGFLGNHTLTLLHAEDYVTGFDTSLHTPIWTAFTVQRDLLTANLTDVNCTSRPDVRLDSNDQINCSHVSDFIHSQNVSYLLQPLFPPGLSTSQDSLIDAIITSNAVIMKEGFATNIWAGFIQWLHNVTSERDTLHVTLGPIFDYDHNGVRDDTRTILQRAENFTNSVIIPTGYFVTVVHCPTDRNGCAEMDYEIQAFTFPHLSAINNCMNQEEFMYDYRARLRDVELLTGLEFLTAARTQTAIRQRVHYPQELWTSSITTS